MAGIMGHPVGEVEPQISEGLMEVPLERRRALCLKVWTSSLLQVTCSLVQQLARPACTVRMLSGTDGQKMDDT